MKHAEVPVQHPQNGVARSWLFCAGGGELEEFDEGESDCGTDAEGYEKRLEYFEYHIAVCSSSGLMVRWCPQEVADVPARR